MVFANACEQEISLNYSHHFADFVYSDHSDAEKKRKTLLRRKKSTEDKNFAEKAAT